MDKSADSTSCGEEWRVCSEMKLWAAIFSGRQLQVTGRLKKNSGSRSGLEFVMVDSQGNVGRRTGKHVGGRVSTLRQGKELETT